MSTKRVPPDPEHRDSASAAADWFEDCLTDLDAELHAVGCDCAYMLVDRTITYLGACALIVSRAMKFEGYEVPEVRKGPCELFANNPPVERVQRPKPTPSPPPKDAP